MPIDPIEPSPHRVGGVIAGATVLGAKPKKTDVFESPEQMAARLLRLAAEMRGAGRDQDAKAVLAGAMAVRLSDLRRVTNDLGADNDLAGS